MLLNGDYYQVLGVPREAKDNTIKKRYIELSLLYHPARCNKQNATEIFKNINEAYHCLIDPIKKAMYNECGIESWQASYRNSLMYKVVYETNNSHTDAFILNTDIKNNALAVRLWCSDTRYCMQLSGSDRLILRPKENRKKSNAKYPIQYNCKISNRTI